MATEYLASLEALSTAKAEQKPPVTGTTTVHLDQPTGAPQQLASGWLYGIPDTPNQIPAHFYTDVGFRGSRGGGSQLPGTRGWYVSRDDFEKRFASMLSNWRTTRQHGGTFVALLPALWGADGGQSKDAPYPGDGGDWGSWDEMLKEVVEGMKREGMLEGVVIDVWNEPDLDAFWNRDIEQWGEVWVRTVEFLRTHLPQIPISGPSLSACPSPSNKPWTFFTSLLARSPTSTLPDQWSWHMENSTDNTTTSLSSLNALLTQNSLPPLPSPPPHNLPLININEYATFSEQTPSSSIWFIAQLERINAAGLRGNWALAGALHDLHAGLVSKPGAGTAAYEDASAGYFPTAEFWLYKYYAQAMRSSGERVRSQPNEAGDADVFAVRGADGVLRVLAGTRGADGVFEVLVRGGEWEVGSEVRVRVFEFGDNAGRRYEEAGEGPQVVEVRRVGVRERGVLRLGVDMGGVVGRGWGFEVGI